MEPLLRWRWHRETISCHLQAYTPKASIPLFKLLAGRLDKFSFETASYLTRFRWKAFRIDRFISRAKQTVCIRERNDSNWNLLFFWITLICFDLTQNQVMQFVFPVFPISVHRLARLVGQIGRLIKANVLISRGGCNPIESKQREREREREQKSKAYKLEMECTSSSYAPRTHPLVCMQLN